MKSFLLLLLVAGGWGAYYFYTHPASPAPAVPVAVAVPAASAPAPTPIVIPPVAEIPKPATPEPATVPEDTSPMPTEWMVLGKELHNVVVGQIYPDRVEITYDGGVGSPKLADLDPALQRRFHYDRSAANLATVDRDAARAKAVADLATRQPTPAAAPAAPSSPAHSPQSPSALTPEQRAQALQRIQILREDIAFMQKDQSKLTSDKKVLKSNGAEMTPGAYSGKISAEQAEIAQLQSQL